MIAHSLSSAMALIEAGRVHEAIDPLSVLAHDNPGHLGAQYALGHALEILQRWPEAAETWLAAANLARAGTAPVDVDQILSDMETGQSSGPITAAQFDDPDPTLSDNEVVTETWARILSGQQQYGEAARVYQMLASKHPDSAKRYLEKARELLQQAEGDTA